MTTSGTDPNLHRPGPQPYGEQLSQDFKGGAIIQQLLAGMTPDSIAMAIQIGHPYGRNPSASNSPSLEFPLYNLRGGAIVSEKLETPITDLKNDLINLLPQDLKERYLQDMQKNARDQSPSFISLDQLLEGAAKSLIFLDGVLNPSNPNLELVNQNYLELPNEMLSNLLGHSSAVTASGIKFLQSEGRNLPTFDALLSHLIEVKSLSTILGALLQGGGLGEKNQALNDVLSRLSLLKENLNGKSFGDNLQVLTPLVENLYLTALSLSLGEGAKSHLASFAMANLDTAEAGQGTQLTGENVKTISKNLADGLTSSVLSELTPAAKELFSHFTAGYLTAALIISQAFSRNEGTDEDASDLVKERNLKDSETSELLASEAAKFFLEQNLMDRAFFSQEGKTAFGSGLDATNGKLIESSLELAALSLINLTYGANNESRASRFMQGLEPQYLDRLSLIENMLLTNLSSASNPENLNRLSSLLTEARLAIAQGDYSAFSEAGHQILKGLGLDDDKLKQELSGYKDIAALLTQSFSGELDDGSIQTGIVQI